MFDTHDLTLFIISGLLLNMAPGPDSLLIMTRSATQGWRAGSAAALGIGAGTMVHIFAAAFGLSALLATSVTAFSVVKYIGAAYLMYIGARLLLSKQSDNEPQAAPLAAPYRSIFFQGFLTNVLNPKIVLFFLAFVPQFINLDASNKALSFVVLGLIFNLNGMIWCHLLAVSAAFASARFKIHPRVSLWLNRSIGAAFVSFGIKLALAKK